VKAKNILGDIPCAGSPDGALYVYDNVSHFQLRKAYWNYIPFPPPGHWEIIGDDPILPGQPIIVVVNGTCTWPPE